MRKSALLRAAAVLAAVVWAMPASAQEQRGSIEGAVRDNSGGVLPGVTVQARNVNTNAMQSAVTDANGVYRFPALQPGSYEISASLSGFVPAKLSGQLLLGQLLKVDIVLTIAGLAETLEVRGDTPIIDVKQNAVTATITSDVIDLIPKGRNFLSAISGVAGTGTETRGGLTIDGAAAAEHRYVVDGLDTTNLRTGVSARDVVVDFLESIQVKQSGYNAEYRAATGGVVSAITKSGSNVFHGDIGSYYEGGGISGLLGDPRPQLRLNPADQTKAEYFTPPRVDETTKWDWVGSIGGPILKSRAWFFLGVNLIKEDTIRTVTWSVTGADKTVNYLGQTQTFDQRPRDKSFQYNAAMQLNSSMRVRFSGSNFRRDGGQGLPNIDNGQRDPVTGEPLMLDANGNRFSSSNPVLFNPRPTTYSYGYENTYAGTLDWTLGDRSYINFTSGYYFDGSGTRGGDYFHGIRRSFGTSNIGFLDVPPELQQLSGFTDNQVNTFNFYDDYSRFFVNADMTVFKDWKGQHAIKFGSQLERLANQVDTGAQFPNVTLQWNSSRSTLDQRNVRGTYGYYSIVRSYTIGDVTANNFGVFVQDQWTPNTRLTVNYGVRAERTYIPSFTPGFVDLTFGWSKQIAPRVGFAYDIHGDGRLKAYGSWGVFYDTPKLEMPRGLWGADHILTYYYTLDSYRLASHQLRRAANQRLSRHLHRAGRLAPPGQRSEQQPDRSRLEARPDAGVHPRSRQGTDPRHVDRRAVRAQVVHPHDRGHGRAGSECRGDLLHRQSRLRPWGVPAGRGIPADAVPEARVRRRRLHVPPPAVGQLVPDDERPRQPAVGQLLRPDEHRRGQPQQPECEPVLRRAVHVLRLEGEHGLRPAAERPAVPVQDPGRVRDAVGHAGRRQLLCGQRLRQLLHDQLQERTGLLQRARRLGPVTDVQPDRPELHAPLPSAEEAASRHSVEHRQFVRSDDLDDSGDDALSR